MHESEIEFGQAFDKARDGLLIVQSVFRMKQKFIESKGIKKIQGAVSVFNLESVKSN